MPSKKHLLEEAICNGWALANPAIGRFNSKLKNQGETTPAQPSTNPPAHPSHGMCQILNPKTYVGKVDIIIVSIPKGTTQACLRMKQPPTYYALNTN